MEKAIVDSGASYTYVPGSVDLMSASPGGGHVWVANGEKEEVKESGWLGPLRARKVESFPRPLVSVRDLVEAVGSVLFDREGVYAVTRTTGGRVESKIGKPTDSRLYGFDVLGLIGHIRDVTSVASVGVRECGSGGGHEARVGGVCREVK